MVQYLTQEHYLTQEQVMIKQKLHQGLLEFIYFHQYDEFDDRVSNYPSLDRWQEFDDDGDWEWCYNQV